MKANQDNGCLSQAWKQSAQARTTRIEKGGKNCTGQQGGEHHLDSDARRKACHRDGSFSRQQGLKMGSA